MKIIALLLSIAVVPAYGTGVIRLSEPVEVGEGYEIYGAPMAESGQPMRLDEIIAAGDAWIGKRIQVTASIGKVCQQKGCFFVAYDGAATARVTFADYDFFIPSDAGGKLVTIVGTFSRKTISQNDARHFARDTGDNPARISGPQTEYTIVASSVLIRQPVVGRAQ